MMDTNATVATISLLSILKKWNRKRDIKLFGVVILDRQIDHDNEEYYYLHIENNIHYISYADWNVSLEQIANDFNEQIQKQVEQMYSIGGIKYWEAKAKLIQSQNGDVVNDKFYTIILY